MAEKWIQKMHMKEGALHKTLNVPAGEKIPASKLSVKSGDSALTAKRKSLAKTLGSFHKQDGKGGSPTFTTPTTPVDYKTWSKNNPVPEPVSKMSAGDQQKWLEKGLPQIQKNQADYANRAKMTNNNSTKNQALQKMSSNASKQGEYESKGAQIGGSVGKMADKVKDFALNSPKLNPIDSAYKNLKNMAGNVGNTLSNANPLSKKNFYRQGVMNSNNPEMYRAGAKKDKIDLNK